jgi:hypothetical protein
MWNFNSRRVPQSMRQNPVAVDFELQQLRDNLIERAAEVGLHHLAAEDIATMLAAELRLLAEKRFGRIDTDALIEARATRLHEKLAQLQAKLTALATKQQERPTPPAPPARPVATNWFRAVGNVLVVFALLGLALFATGRNFGWLNPAILSLGAAFTLLNWTHWSAARRCVWAWISTTFARWGDHWKKLWANACVNLLMLRLAALDEERQHLAMRRRHVEAWMQQQREILGREFAYHRKRAEVAARLFAEPNGSQREFDWAAFERDGATKASHEPQWRAV